MGDGGCTEILLTLRNGDLPVRLCLSSVDWEEVCINVKTVSPFDFKTQLTVVSDKSTHQNLCRPQGRIGSKFRVTMTPGL